jgi:hypothetical protein
MPEKLAGEKAMNTQGQQSDQNTLSEKARRLLAAHDREVSQFRMERASAAGGYSALVTG